MATHSSILAWRIPMERGAWRAIVYGVAESDTTEQLSTENFSMVNKVTITTLGFPGGSDSKESSCNAADLGSIPELGRSPGEGHGNLLQYSCLENPIDRGAWWALQSLGSQRVRHD